MLMGSRWTPRLCHNEVLVAAFYPGFRIARRPRAGALPTGSPAGRLAIRAHKDVYKRPGTEYDA